jgi:hypothetical protein
VVTVEWKRDRDRCPFASGALHGDSAAERLDSVAQPNEAGAAGGICPADAVRFAAGRKTLVCIRSLGECELSTPPAA